MNHLDLDALADLLVGEGNPRDVEHLRSCTTCARQLTDLEAAQAPVDASLAALPPLAVPAPLAAQLTAGDAATGRTAGSNVLPLAPARRATGARRREPRGRPPWRAVTGIAAAIVLVSGGAALLIRSDHHLSASSAKSSGASLARAPEVRRLATGTSYTAATLAIELPSLLVPAQAGSVQSGPGPASSRATSQAGAGATPAAGTVPAELAPLQGTSALAACLSALTPADQPGLPLAVDYARYGGKPALVVVLPSARPGKLDVYVVGPNCTATDADVIYFTRLAQP